MLPIPASTARTLIFLSRLAGTHLRPAVLRTELEYQHKRLDEIRDAQRADASQGKELGVDAEDARGPAHEDWANDE